MPSTNEVQAARHRERYENDPEFRAKVLESNRRYRAGHKAKVRKVDNSARRKRYAEDTVYRTSKRRRNDEWDQQNPERRKRISRENHLLSKYGLLSEDYDQMVADRGGRCDICGGQPERLCVDHDHTTGNVRGLLCRPCNSAIGQLGESIPTLRNAIIYLSVNGD